MSEGHDARHEGLEDVKPSENHDERHGHVAVEEEVKEPENAPTE